MNTSGRVDADAGQADPRAVAVVAVVAAPTPIASIDAMNVRVMPERDGRFGHPLARGASRPERSLRSGYSMTKQAPVGAADS